MFTGSRIHGYTDVFTCHRMSSDFTCHHINTDSQMSWAAKNKSFFQPRFMDSRITLVHFCFLLPRHYAQVHAKK